MYQFAFSEQKRYSKKSKTCFFQFL